MLTLTRLAAVLAAFSLPNSIHARPSALLSHRDDSNSSTLPTVDLGYVVQRATVFNDTGNYYNFSNIRYAQPPTGDLRFRAPLPPKTDRTTIETGEVDRICPQSNPAWLLTAAEFVPQYLAGKTNFTAADFSSGNSSSSSLPIQDPRTTEDCLFLDVLVPKPIFEQSSNASCAGSPVLVWFYGGGYTAGSKYSQGNPAGLLARSQNGIVYVTFNYRLGAFGWLAGPSFQEQGGVANVGLYDQRMALEWVKTNIRKFGGDPSRITVLGESAGGGSIMHQITAFGNSTPAPFHQAIPQSPGWQPIVSYSSMDSTLNTFLALSNVSTLSEARQLPFETLQTANIIQTAQSAYGQFTFGPALDGIFVPKLPGQLLSQGRFAKDVKILVGHNSNEGIVFTSPFISNETVYSQQIDTLFPTLANLPDVKNYIINTLYPSSSYPNAIARAAQTIADVAFVCNTYYLDKAYNNETYAYVFEVPPAIHGGDLPYTFWNGEAGVDGGIATVLQEWIVNFAESGNPGQGFTVYGSNASVEVLTTAGVSVGMDPAKNERCEWWEAGRYY